MSLRWILPLVGLLSGCTSPLAHWNTVMRPEASADAPAGRRFLVMPAAQPEAHYACSFIEFDGHGDLLAPTQIYHLYERIKSIQRPILLVTFCHGWRNNAESDNAVEFISLLQSLARDFGADYDIEGVYLAWHANPFKPAVSDNNWAAIRNQLGPDFDGQSVLDRQATQPLPHWLTWLPETLSLYSVKESAEYRVSHFGVAQALFTLANQVRAKSQPGARQNRVIVLGHSFGALMLERAISSASIALLTAQAGGDSSQVWAHWPLDLVIYLNAAAPSLYAKQMIEFLDNVSPLPNRPHFIAITSEADSATRFWFPASSALKRSSYPDLARSYYPFLGSDQGAISAWTLYSHTAGHSPLFISRTISLDATGKSAASSPTPMIQFLAPLRSNSDINHLVFDDSKSHGAGKSATPSAGPEDKPDEFFPGSDHRIWQLHVMPGREIKDHNNGKMPRYALSNNYMVISTDKNLIQGHDDIWNPDLKMMVVAMCKEVISPPSEP